MPTFEEFLRENGASPEDVKALTEGSFSGTARKAFDALQAKLDQEAQAHQVEAEARKKAEESQAAYDRWYQEQAVPEYKNMERQLLAARANEAKAVAAIKAAQERGLLEVASDLGYGPETTGTEPKPNPGTAGFDPNRYFTREDIVQIAEKEGEAIAVAQDIAYEHRVLFPDKPLNFRELRREAVQRRVPVEQLWMEKFGVAQAREERVKKEHEAEVARWKAEGAKEKEAELVSKYGNPDTRPLAPSISPFAARPERGRDKLPWEQGENERSNRRVADMTKKVMEIAVH